MQRGNPIEFNFQGLEMQNWNILTYRAQRVDEKRSEKSRNGSIFVKNGSFFVFSAGDSKILVPVWAKCLSAPERSYWVLLENGMVNRFGSYHLWDIECTSIKKTAESTKNAEILYFQELTSS